MLSHLKLPHRSGKYRDCLPSLAKTGAKAKAKVNEVGIHILLLDSWANKMTTGDPLLQGRENSQEQWSDPPNCLVAESKYDFREVICPLWSPISDL